jgi:hypothetical protein
MGDSIIIARGLDSARRLASLTADGRCTPDALVALLTSPEGSEARREQSPPNHEDGAGLDPAQKAVFDALRNAFLKPEATCWACACTSCSYAQAWAPTQPPFWTRRIASRRA